MGFYCLSDPLIPVLSSSVSVTLGPSPVKPQPAWRLEGRRPKPD